MKRHAHAFQKKLGRDLVRCMAGYKEFDTETVYMVCLHLIEQSRVEELEGFDEARIRVD